jgi:hypothetical protein
MLLHLARAAPARRWTGWPLYQLTAALDCDHDERRLILAHGIDAERLYTAPAAFDLMARAEAAHARARSLSSWKAANLPAIYWHSGNCLVLAVRARLAFHVTVGDLMRPGGALLQSTDLTEIRAAEAGLSEAVVELNAAVEAARGFEAGQENLLDPIEPDARTHPAAWPRHWRT